MHYTAQQQVVTRHIARTAQQQIKNKTGVGVTMLVYPADQTDKTPEHMLTVIAMALDMDPACYRMKSRERSIVELRFLGALLLRRNFPLITLQQIAALFGGQDHSSIISGITRAQNLIYCGDERFVEKYNIVSQTVNLWIREHSPNHIA
jgi:chromosomal replication initiation ATPase DnaA